MDRSTNGYSEARMSDLCTESEERNFLRRQEHEDQGNTQIAYPIWQGGEASSFKNCP